MTDGRLWLKIIQYILYMYTARINQQMRLAQQRVKIKHKTTECEYILYVQTSNAPISQQTIAHMNKLTNS